MDAGEFARGWGAGREGLPTTSPVSDPSGTEANRSVDSGVGVRASNRTTRVWEAAYRHYGNIWELTARSPKGDPAAAREMAAASWTVAAAWRQIAAATTLPWWTLVALEAAGSSLRSAGTRIQSTRRKPGT
jgi:hypothetical protein